MVVLIDVDGVGSRLRAARTAARLRRARAAALVGVSARDVTDHENGARQPTAAQVVRYASAYKVPAGSLLFPPS